MKDRLFPDRTRDLTLPAAGSLVNFGVLVAGALIAQALIGGMGSLSGAVIGGFALGIAEVFLRSWLPSGIVGLTDGVVFLLIAVLFIFRPQGIITVPHAERV